MPAACGFCTRSGSAAIFFSLRTTMSASLGSRPQARECVGKEQSPKRGHAGRAAKVVSAGSRDHANRRAQSTRDRSATSTRSRVEATIASAVVVRSRAQVPALEILVPGRQGIRAKRDFNPACRSAYLPWDRHHGLLPCSAALYPVPWRCLAAVAAWGVNQSLLLVARRALFAERV